MSTFENLVAEGEAVPTEGWDFSWFAGRASEQRPSWGYARLLAERMAKAIPSARVEEIPGAHHHVTLDAPRALAECVRAWLALTSSQKNE